MNLILESFVRYCEQNPEQRFWQALRNWSGYNFVLVSDRKGEDYRDTFYWNSRSGSE